MSAAPAKPRIAVHKFTSCDGCQLAFLNLGEDLLAITELVDIVHFAEAGPVDPDEPVDIAFIEGSISTPDEAERIRRIRANCGYMVTLGACATSGGIQALRNLSDSKDWVPDIYAHPEHIDSLATCNPIAAYAKVDLELWGCPINSAQLLMAVRALLFGVSHHESQDKVCLECKRRHTVCVMVSKGLPCMGPVTRTGCGAICPRFGRDCYACYGPAESANTTALSRRLTGLGLTTADVQRRFWFINNSAPVFAKAGKALEEDPDV